MESQISIPVKTALFLDLAGFLEANGSNRDPVEAVSIAISYWIDNASWKQDVLMPEIASQHAGYIWMSVDVPIFLPHGTAIRMRYKGTNYFAKVELDAIVYEGVSMTPSVLANKIAGGSRNAWRDLYIQKPGHSTWELADNMRRQMAKQLGFKGANS